MSESDISGSFGMRRESQSEPEENPLEAIRRHLAPLVHAKVQLVGLYPELGGTRFAPLGLVERLLPFLNEHGGLLVGSREGRLEGPKRLPEPQRLGFGGLSSTLRRWHISLGGQ